MSLTSSRLPSASAPAPAPAPPTSSGTINAPQRHGQHIGGTMSIALLAMLIGTIASLVMWQQNWLLLYSDAQSHLTIARRILESKEPGFAQIGTVWLPFPHLLLLPFVGSFVLWQTGLAAAIVGVACLGASAAALWRITARLAFHPVARWITLAVFVFNPSILYLYTVALTEPVLIACLLAAVAGLSGWIQARPSYSPGKLAIFAGVPTAAAVLSRYEGWAFVFFGTLFVVIASWRRWRSLSLALNLTLAYLAVPVVAVAWWVSFNWVVFGSPLEFINGAYSAAAQQSALAASGLLPTQGNLGLSITTYNATVLGVAGISTLCLAAIGGALLIFTRGFSTTAMLIWLPGFIYPFAILSLFLGQTAIRNATSLPPGTFNLRFAAGLIPLLALLIGVLVDVSIRRWAPLGWTTGAIALVATLVFTGWAYSDPAVRVDVIREGYSNVQGGADASAAAQWLAENNTGGDILIDEGANPVLMKLGVPLERIYARFTGSSYENALSQPSDFVSWVYVDTGNPADLVWQRLKDDPGFHTRFAPVFESGSVRVFERLDQAGGQQ